MLNQIVKVGRTVFTKVGQVLSTSTSKATALGVTTYATGQTAFAQIDVEGVETALQAAEASGVAVGTIVIGIVASLVVVSIIIGLVKKL